MPICLVLPPPEGSCVMPPLSPVVGCGSEQISVAGLQIRVIPPRSPLDGSWPQAVPVHGGSGALSVLDAPDAVKPSEELPRARVPQSPPGQSTVDTGPVLL